MQVGGFLCVPCLEPAAPSLGHLYKVGYSHASCEAGTGGQETQAREGRGGRDLTKSHLQLLQLWVEAEEGHVAHVGTRRGVTLSQQHEP